MIRILNGRPMPYKVHLPWANDARRNELVSWCRGNFPNGGNIRWIPPYRPSGYSKWMMGDHSCVMGGAEAWSFLREEDAVFFDLTWEGR